MGTWKPAAMITLDNLTVSYRQHPALHHISGSFTAGSLTAVVGPNGSGKSTLLKSIVDLVKPSGGHLRRQVAAEQIAFLPQVTEIDRSFPIQVQDAVMLGAWGTLGAWGGVGRDLLACSQAAIQTVGLQGFEARPVGTLSSGQFQRVLFARLILQDAQLILLDEPFTALDSRTTTALLALMHQWHQEGRTVVAVLHDDAQALAHFDRTLLLARELVAWGPTADVLTDAHLQRARALAEAWDDQAEVCHVDEPTP